MIDRWEQVKQILADASELPPEDRKAFVLSAGSGDRELIAEVESLLASMEEAEADFLEDSPIQLTGFGDSLIGRWVGEYRVECLIAQGGMGSVYRATKQMDGATLAVALKVIRFPGGHHYVSRRFRMERQILATLAHTNIVRFLDGGVTLDGVPYIVTEFLDAICLETWLRETQPTLSQKLKVFQALCDGIAYAHRNLIVHGDIKPSNVLITRDGTPKVLDFGIARLLEQDTQSVAADNTVTMTPALTPWWASPEQLRGEPLSIESDCYELGRILFFMLTGEKPHDFTGLSNQQILEKLRREPPPKPSAVTGDARMAGDLDNIVHKALEYDRHQRYRSVDALSEDITRHLSCRPISARSQTRGYRLEKFIRRNARVVAVSTVATLALVGALGFAFYQAGQAKFSQASSRQRFEQLRALANSLLDADSSLIPLQGSTEVRARLVRSALGYLDQLAREENNDPKLLEDLAAAYEKIGDIQGRPGATNLGQTQEALESYRKSELLRETIRRGALRPQDFIPASNNLARTYNRLSAAMRAMGDAQGALGYERKALGIRQAMYEGNPENLTFKRDLAASLTTLSSSLSQIGDFAGVMETRREALKMYQEILAASPDVAADQRGYALALARMGSIELHEGQLKDSLEHYRQALEVDTKLFIKDPSDAQLQLNKGWAHNNLGVILNKTGRYADALEQYAVAKTYFERISKADPRDVRSRTLLETNRVRTALTYLAMGKLRESLTLAEVALKGRETLAMQNRSNAGAQGEVAESHLYLGQIYAAMGQRQRAHDQLNIAHHMLTDLIRNERSNAAMKEDLLEVEKALKALGAAPRLVAVADPSAQ